jgi:hypothetical protein
MLKFYTPSLTRPSNTFTKKRLDLIAKIDIIKLMINVHPNPNFSNWFNVVFNGKLIDSSKSHAQAMEIAKSLSLKHNAPILSTK